MILIFVNNIIFSLNSRMNDLFYWSKLVISVTLARRKSMLIKPCSYSISDTITLQYKRQPSLQAKYIIDQQLGGAMFWELSFDDPKGKYCEKGKFPLLNTIKEAFGLESGETPLTKNVDPDIVLMTKGKGSTTLNETGLYTIISALVCICLCQWFMKL